MYIGLAMKTNYDKFLLDEKKLGIYDFFVAQRSFVNLQIIDRLNVDIQNVPMYRHHLHAITLSYPDLTCQPNLSWQSPSSCWGCQEGSGEKYIFVNFVDISTVGNLDVDIETPNNFFGTIHIFEKMFGESRSKHS
jgi:hypothetical protein